MTRDATLTRSLAAALIAVFVTGPAFAAGMAPAQIANAFCNTRLAGDDTALKALLTPSLLKVVAEAEERNAIVAKSQPDDKPPFGDGIPYQSFPDRPAECKAGVPVERAGRTDVPVTYIFPEQKDADWTDTIELVVGPAGALVDDVRYQASVDGSGEVTLREVLHDAFDQ